MKIKVDENRYIMPVYAVQNLIESFEKIESKRQKLIEKGRLTEDFPSINLEFKHVDEDTQKEVMNLNLSASSKRQLKHQIREKNVYIAQISSAQLPTLNNWQVLGYLTKSLDSESYIMNSYQKESPIPQKYRETDPCNCDHCGHSRKRNNTYILKNEESGETMQVGSTCMDDFVSQETMEMLMLYSNAFNILDTYDPDEQEVKRGNSPIFFLDKIDFLSSINAAMRAQGGFISSKKEDFNHGKYKTFQTALHMMEKDRIDFYLSRLNLYYNQNHDYLSDKAFDNYRSFVHSLKIEQQDLDKVQEVIQYFNDNPPTKDSDEYYFNMHSVMTNGSAAIFKEEPARVCYAIQYYDNIKIKQERELEQKRKDAGKLDIPVYLGQEKTKIENIELQLTHVSETETDYGYIAHYNFLTRDGREVYWGASNSGRPDCFNHEDFPYIDDIITFVNKCKMEDKPIFLQMKGSVSSHSDYINKKGNRVINTKIGRANSVSEFYHEPMTEGNIVFNEKYNLNEFKITNIKTGIAVNTGEKQYQYTLETADGIEFKFLPFKKIPNLKEGDHFQAPVQFSHESELVGLNYKNIKPIESFTEDFQPEILTKAKAAKFNQTKTKRKPK